MSRLHLINANKIFTAQEKELLKKLHSSISLNLMILENGQVITNRRAYKIIRKDNGKKSLISNFAQTLKNKFGSGIKLRIIETKDCHNFILEKINFN